MKDIKLRDVFFDEANGRYLTVDSVCNDPNVYCCITEEFNESGELEITGRAFFTKYELNHFNHS